MPFDNPSVSLPSSDTSVAHVLEQVLDFFGDNPEKWTKFRARSAEGAMCMVGAALNFVPGQGINGLDSQSHALLNTIAWTVCKERGGVIDLNSVVYIAAYNDLPSTTFEDVMRVLRSALATARARNM